MRHICMSALAPVFLASAFSGSALAQVTYVPYGGGQPVYAAQTDGQQYGQYGQQYYVYQQQPGYATSVAPAYVPAAPRYATPAPTYAPPPPAPTYAAAPAAPAPAAASESHGGFLEAIFGGPTIQAHVYQPAQPQYQTPATQPTVIDTPVAAYTPSSQGDMSNYPIDPRYLRQMVDYPTDEKPGTIVIDTPNKFLYLVEDGGKALRYGIGVGRPGFTWAGVKEITAKREWPDWYPPSDMLQRRPDLPRYMPGGLENPLGSRAMYLGSTLYRIHGSNEPWTIGTNVSSGCIRMRNADVEDLYNRVKIGTKVVVI
jgi:lipoprotein-anchoring transpeptidase ErfK/SrfK